MGKISEPVIESRTNYEINILLELEQLPTWTDYKDHVILNVSVFNFFVTMHSFTKAEIFLLVIFSEENLHSGGNIFTNNSPCIDCMSQCFLKLLSHTVKPYH